jgi:RNA polymerase subunit RPABC4/transcription elongation factor Spt4
MFCGNCGKDIEDNAKFCPYCGCGFSVPVTGIIEPAIKQAQYTREAIMSCGNCGIKIEEGDKFCQGCGHEIFVSQSREFKCPSCGTVLKDDAEFCKNCGEAVKGGVSRAMSPLIENTVSTINRVRHGFTSFWLILGIVSCSLSGLMYIFLYAYNSYTGNLSFWNSYYILLGSAMILELISLVLLLNWKKIGFWLLIGDVAIISILSITTAMANSNPVVQIIIAVIGTVSFWAVLQIPKNGKSTWEQLGK